MENNLFDKKTQFPTLLSRSDVRGSFLLLPSSRLHKDSLLPKRSNLTSSSWPASLRSPSPSHTLYVFRFKTSPSGRLVTLLPSLTPPNPQPHPDTDTHTCLFCLYGLRLCTPSGKPSPPSPSVKTLPPLQKRSESHFVYKDFTNSVCLQVWSSDGLHPCH